MRALRRIALALFVLALASCELFGFRTSVLQSKDGPSGSAALLVGWSGTPGEPDYLPGVDGDLKRLEALLKEPGFALEVLTLRNPTVPEVLEAARRTARRLANDATLVIHFEGRVEKGKGGDLTARGGDLSLEALGQALREARTTPVARLLVTVDAVTDVNVRAAAGAFPDDTTTGLAARAVWENPSDEWNQVHLHYAAVDASRTKVNTAVFDAKAPPPDSGAVQGPPEPVSLADDGTDVAERMATDLLAAIGGTPGLAVPMAESNTSDPRQRNTLYDRALLLVSTIDQSIAKGWGNEHASPVVAAASHALRTLSRDHRAKATLGDFAGAMKMLVTRATTDARVPAYRADPPRAVGEPLFTKTVTVIKAGSDDQAECRGAWGYEWEPGHARGASGCRDPKSYCQCWKTEKGCGLFSKGADRGTPPLAMRDAADAGGVCYESCTDLARSNKSAMKDVCDFSLVMLNGAKRLEVWSYRHDLESGALALQAATEPCAAADMHPATVEVRVAAKNVQDTLYVDGSPTSSLGPHRVFETPEICATRDYTYQLQLKGGAGASPVKTITLRGGAATMTALP